MRIANSSNLTLAVKKYKQLRRKQLVSGPVKSYQQPDANWVADESPVLQF